MTVFLAYGSIAMLKFEWGVALRLSSFVTLFLFSMAMGCSDARAPKPGVPRTGTSAASDVDFDRKQALEILAESTELLSFIGTNRSGQPQVATTHRFEIIAKVWALGAYADKIDALGGPKAADVAYLLLRELKCETTDDISRYYEIVAEDFKHHPGSAKPHLEIKEFLVRALSKRPEPTLISLE